MSSGKISAEYDGSNPLIFNRFKTYSHSEAYDINVFESHNVVFSKEAVDACFGLARGNMVMKNMHQLNTVIRPRNFKIPHRFGTV